MSLRVRLCFDLIIYRYLRWDPNPSVCVLYNPFSELIVRVLLHDVDRGRRFRLTISCVALDSLETLHCTHQHDDDDDGDEPKTMISQVSMILIVQSRNANPLSLLSPFFPQC